MSAQGTKPVKTSKIVEITVNSNGKCSPNSAHVKKNDQIIWIGDAQEVHFASANPFDQDHGKKFPPKQHHTVDNEPKRYKYTVRTSSGSYDPEVVVDPPGL